MYAQLCRKLSERVPNFESPPPSHNPSQKLPPFANTYCTLLLAKCKDEFENRNRASESFGDGPLSGDKEEQRSVAKQKMLGNIRFICELGRMQLVTEPILHQCIQQLCKKKMDESIQNKIEDLECLCQIMKTVGCPMDTEKAKLLMDQYFERVKRYANEMILPPRIRFMLQDVLELRRNKWVPRRVQREQNPQTITQIREEAAKDHGVNLSRIGYGNQFNPNHMRTYGPYASGFGPGQRVLDDAVSGYYPFMHPAGGGGVPQELYAQGAKYTNNQAASNYPPMNNQMMNHANYRGSRSQEKRHDNRDPSGRQILSKSPPQQQQQQGPNNLAPRFQKKQLMQQSQILQRPNPSFTPPMMGNGPIVHNMMNTNGIIQMQKSFNSVDPNNISLRPAQILKPNMGSQITMPVNNSTGNGSPLTQNSLFNKSNQNNKIENLNDANAKIAPPPNQNSKEMLIKKADEMMDEFMADKTNIDEIIEKFKELKIPKNFQSDVLLSLIKNSLEKSEDDRVSTSKFISSMQTESIVSNSSYVAAFRSILNQLPDLEDRIPRLKSSVAAFMARAIVDGVFTLKNAYEFVEGGQLYPLFLLCLQQLHLTEGQSWLIETFNESELNLMMTLSEIDRKKERLADILRDRGLSFLSPLLRVEFDLAKQMNSTDCTPATLYRWIKDNVDASLHSTIGFVNILFTAIVKYVVEKSKQATSEATFNETGNGTTAVVDYENEYLKKYQAVIRTFVHEKLSLQLIILYSLQTYCFNLGFPKGMLLRWFVFLYDMEIVEEEVFLKWKEDINDEYPGKGKALFQVNTWLTWLEEAEEEDEEEEDECSEDIK